MTDWIIVPRNQSFDGVKQGIDLSKNPKDYVKKIREKEAEESKVETDMGTIMITPTKVKINDVSEITNKKRRKF